MRCATPLVFLVSVCMVCVRCDKETLPHGVHQPHYEGDAHNHNVEFDHEAILGSKEANDEFEELPPHEAKERLATLVDKMDLNEDETINEEELTAWITSSFISLNREESISRIETQDENKDGKISWEEYLFSTYGYKPDELKDMDVDKNPDIQSFSREIEEDKKRFGRADIDADTFLNLPEYTAFLHPYDYTHMQEYELDRTLEGYDKDGDKQVSFKEYIGPDPGSQEMQLMDKENYDSYDLDKNGFLSREELRAWILPDMKDTVKLEVEHLFAETDLDKDGKLQKDEIIDQHMFWVGSSATNFGSELHKHDPQEL